MSRFPEEDNVKFVESHCCHQCLWNLTCVQRHAKKNERMGKSDLVAPKDVASKINNIRQPTLARRLIHSRTNTYV
jgi:hypothetical protein